MMIGVQLKWKYYFSYTTSWNRDLLLNKNKSDKIKTNNYKNSNINRLFQRFRKKTFKNLMIFFL